MTRRKVISMTVVLAVLLVIVLLFLAWIAPGLRYTRMRYHHMSWIEYGVQKYKRAHGEFPTNIAQIVQAKILPSESEIYACPLLMRSPIPMFPRDRDYRKSDYALINSNQILYIQVRSNVAEQLRLRYPQLTLKDLTLETDVGNDGPYINNADGTPATPPGKWK